MYSYEVYNQHTSEYVRDLCVDEMFEAPGERIGSIVMDGKDAPGTVTQIWLKLDEHGGISRRIWVKQDSYPQP